MGRLLRAYLAMRKAILESPERQDYWRRHPDEAARLRAENDAIEELCAEEADELDGGRFSSAARLGQIAAQAGLKREDLERLLRGIVHTMTEGLRPRPTEHTEGDAS
jgi:hypothetical protein